MAEGRSTSGRSSPTIKTLAAHTGYSIATISKALGGAPVVTDATREGILSPTRELGDQAGDRGALLRAEGLRDDPLDRGPVVVGRRTDP